jgi:hypothetical protein
VENFAAPGLYAPAELPPAFAGLQSVTALRMASAAYAAGPGDDPANTVWAPRIYGDIEVRQNGMDALGIGGRVALGIAEVEVANADGALDTLVAYGLADGRAATIRVAPVTSPLASNFGSPLGTAAIAFSGVVQRVEGADNRRARIAITDASERLATPLQRNKFDGAGGLGGGASLTGKPKPIALGEVFNITPVALGNIDLGDGSLPTYMVHWRAVSSITAVRIRGVVQTLVGVAPTTGQARVWLSSGAFQLGSSPDGVVTADVLGDATSTYVNTTAGILRRLLTSVGPGLLDAQLDASAWDFADTDLPGAVGFYQPAEETSAGAVVDTILAGCGAILAGGRDGRLRLVDPLASGTAQFTLPMPWILALTPAPLPAALRPAPATVAIDYKPNFTPTTDLAGSVTATDRALYNAAASTSRTTSGTVQNRVAQPREMRIPGLYRDAADAAARAARYLTLFASGARAFEVVTDRYLGSIEIGALGAIAYPAHGLDAGVGVVVLGYTEALAARRLTLTVVTVPWVTIPNPEDVAAWFMLDEDLLA